MTELEYLRVIHTDDENCQFLIGSFLGILPESFAFEERPRRFLENFVTLVKFLSLRKVN